MIRSVKHIALVGFMGSGKTTLGKKLAAELGRGFCDLDQYIEEKQGKSIAELFDTLGEDGFRLVERAALQEVLSHQTSWVIAVGGGTPCFFDNMERILERAFCIYLKTPIDILVARLLPEMDSRPLLKGLKVEELRGRILELLATRERFYEMADEECAEVL